MPDLWSEMLHRVTLGGVEFPVARRQVTGGRRFARHRPAYRDAQDSEGIAREPYRFEFRVPLFAGVDAGLFPDTYDALRVIFDTEDRVELVDPILGPVMVQPEKFSDVATAERRDGVMLDISLEEVGDEPFLVRVLPEDPRAAAELEAATIDQGLEDLEVSEDDVADGLNRAAVPLAGEELELVGTGDLFVGLVDAFFGAVESAALAADEVAARVDAFRSRMDAVMQFDALEEVGSWSIVNACVRLGDTLGAAAEKLAPSQAPVIEWTVPHVMSSIEIAVVLYGDPGRSGEVEQRNPYRYPHAYPQGRVLHVLAE